RSAFTGFSVTVNAVDANWNVVNTVTDTVRFSSSDSAALLPADGALLAGTSNFQVYLNTVGTATITASDVTDGTKAANTSPAITVSAAQFTQTTGGGAIPADTVGGAFTTLGGP